MTKLNRVVVLMGGPSSEAAISRKSGQAVAQALQTKGYFVQTMELSQQTLVQLLQEPPQLVWLALHGQFGEDGSIQGFLELAGIPYTGSGILASALAMDKWMARQILLRENICLQPAIAINLANVDTLTIPTGWLYPLVVKPATGGSSIAIALVTKQEELLPAVYRSLQESDIVIIEPFIAGREFSVALHNGAVIGDVEIVPAKAFYDYEAKYERNDTKYYINPALSTATRQNLHEQAKIAFTTLQCEGFARADFIICKQDEKPYFLEVNTIPGMTDHSLLPQIAQAAGISFADLVEQILWEARLKC